MFSTPPHHLKHFGNLSKKRMVQDDVLFILQAVARKGLPDFGTGRRYDLI